LGVDVFALVADRGFNRLGDLRDQLQRAGLSISNNIAEGFERGSTSELLAYLYIARGSAGETRSGLRFAARLAERGILKSEISNLRSPRLPHIPHVRFAHRPTGTGQVAPRLPLVSEARNHARHARHCQHVV